MSEDAEMVDYRLARTIRDQPCDLHIFESFSGYSHPVKPVRPMRWRDALAKAGFVKAYYCHAKFGTALVYFKAQGYERAPVDLGFPLGSDGKAERYYTVLHERDAVAPGREIDPQEALDLDEYLRVTFAPGSDRAQRAELVTVDDWFTYEYFYDDGGALTKSVIDNGIRVTVLEPGQPPRIIQRRR